MRTSCDRMTLLADLELALKNSLVSKCSRSARTFPCTCSLSQDLEDSHWKNILDHFKDLTHKLATLTSTQECRQKMQSLLASGGQVQHLELTLLAVAALQMFVAVNWTGFREECGVSINREVLESILVLDGESVVSVAKHLDLLCLSELIFEEQASNIYSKNWAFMVWRFRSLIIHQDVLTEKSEKIHSQALEIIESLEDNAKFRSALENDKYLAINLELESAQFYAKYFEVTPMESCISRAMEKSGLEVSETGALGKRTRFQVKDLAQLTLDINYKSEGMPDNPHVSGNDLPTDIKLEDEARLDKIKFVEDRSNQKNLTLQQQAILLSLFTMKDRSKPMDELSREEYMPYLDAILSSKVQTWSLKMAALLYRSKLESNNKRSVERAMMQIQTLVDCISDVENEFPDKSPRMDFIYCSRLPPHWQIEQVLCQALLSMGSTKAALDVALRLELWEDVIHCYHQLQLRHKAAEVIRTQLELKETPLLYCMLGDATDEIQHYHKALEMTNQRSARAFRSLGLHFYFRKDYEKAVQFLRKSIELNSFQLGTILRLAYSATQIEDWELAAQMYRKYCSYDSDNFEAWNNLSNAYIRLGQKARAWKVLQEAVKCDFDNWKIWDNILLVSTDLAHFEDVIRAYHRILDLKEKHVDVEVLHILVAAIKEDKLDNQGEGCRRFLPDALSLFGRLTSLVTNEGKIWEFYSDLKTLTGDPEPVQVCQFMQKAVASMSQKASWEKDVTKCEEVLKMASKYLLVAQEMSSKLVNSSQRIPILSSAKMSTRTILSKIKQAQTSIDTGEIVDPLKKLFQTTSNDLEMIQQLITDLRT